MRRRKKKQRWSDFTPHQRQAIVAAGIVQNSLLIAAWVDLYRRPAEQVKGNKRVWAVGALVSWIGPISYFLFGRRSAAAQTTP
jgi:hypothetical protein